MESIYDKILSDIRMHGKSIISKDEIDIIRDGINNFCLINELTYEEYPDKYEFYKLSNLCLYCD